MPKISTEPLAHVLHGSLRCSAIVVRNQAVLLVHRVWDGGDDWVLPGGTPRPGESMAACARREVREETGIQAEPTGVAFVLEAAEPASRLRTVDLVFMAREYGCGCRKPRPRHPTRRCSLIRQAV